MPFCKKMQLLPLENLNNSPSSSGQKAERQKAKGHLVSCGFNVNQITTKIVSGVQSRAGVLVKEAKEGGYGTIVVGRRGLSRVQDFFMGRVSNKVIQLAEGKAVCVVS
jgi:nucleotide-binding universal stress UspA family protein